MHNKSAAEFFCLSFNPIHPMKNRLLQVISGTVASALYLSVAPVASAEYVHTYTVPENGATVLLLGGAIAGLALLRRRLLK
jgi:hypothetical protein